MAMSKLWLSAAFALASFALVFILQGVPDGFLVLRNSANHPDDLWQLAAERLVPTLMVQAVLVGWLQIYLHTLNIRVRWDHLLSVVVFIWGTMLLVLVFFGEFYFDHFGREGSWSIARDLTVFSIPLIPLLFIMTIVRDVLASRRASSQ